MKGCLIKLGKFALLLFGILVVLAIIGLLNQKPTQKEPAQPVAVVSGPTATSAVALVVNTSAPTDTSAPTNTSAPTATPVPTNTSAPTATPAPTNTFTPTKAPAPTRTFTPTKMPTPTKTPTTPPTPTATLAPQEAFKAKLAKALGKGNRDVPRIASVEFTPEAILVQWAINDNLTDHMLKVGARMDTAKILKAVHEAGLPYQSLTLAGTMATVDGAGNKAETVLLRLTYNQATVERINWQDTGFANFVLYKTVYELADSQSVSPLLQEDAQ